MCWKVTNQHIRRNQLHLELVARIYSKIKGSQRKSFGALLSILSV